MRVKVAIRNNIHQEGMKLNSSVGEKSDFSHFFLIFSGKNTPFLFEENQWRNKLSKLITLHPIFKLLHSAIIQSTNMPIKTSV